MKECEFLISEITADSQFWLYFLFSFSGLKLVWTHSEKQETISEGFFWHDVDVDIYRTVYFYSEASSLLNFAQHKRNADSRKLMKIENQ